MENKNFFDQLLQSSLMTKIVLVTVIAIWTIVFVLLIAGTTLVLERRSEALEPTVIGSIPTIGLNPAAASPGSTVAVNGLGWNPGSTVLIYLIGSESPSFAVSSANVDASGHLTTDFILPSDLLGADQGTVQVLAQAEDGSGSAQAYLTVIAISEPATATDTPVPSPTTSATDTPTPVIPTSTPTPQPALAQIISTNNLNVRSGPGVNYAVVGILQSGQTAPVTGLSYDRGWWQIRFADGFGWVSAQYVTAQNVENVPLVQADSAPPAPTTTPLPTATPAPVVITDWRGEYYNNTALSGAPVLVRNDVGVNFNWGNGSPAVNVPADNFSTRWTRSQYFDGGTYRFHIVMDDGARLWVDGRLVIDAWSDGAARQVTGDYALGSGQHNLRVEYYERSGGSGIALWWEKIGNGNNDDDDNDHDFSEWKGEYYSDWDLDNREFTRNDEDIDFDWGDNAPRDLPHDNFSVRWSRRVDFDDGRYRFEARADDGIRVYLDGNRIIDEWHSSDGDQSYTVERDLSGSHKLLVEYYEHSGQARVEFDWKRIGNTPDPQTMALNASIAHLAALTRLPASAISLVSIEAANWPDTLFGCPVDGVVGSPVIIPGYRIILAAAGQQYEYHTDQNGLIVLCQPPATPTPTSTATTSPTNVPTAILTTTATTSPTEEPTATPTSTTAAAPIEEPTATSVPTEEPTATPTSMPTEEPTATLTPTTEPAATPIATATLEPPTPTTEPPTPTPEPSTPTPEPPTPTPEPPTPTSEPPTPTPTPEPPIPLSIPTDNPISPSPEQ